MLDTNLSRNNAIGIPFTNIISMPCTYSQHTIANITNIANSSSNKSKITPFLFTKIKKRASLKKKSIIILRLNTLKRGSLLIKKNSLDSKAKKVISTTIVILSSKNKLYSSSVNKVITRALLLNISILCYILQDILSQGKVLNLIILLIQCLKSAYNISPSPSKEEDTSNYNFLLLSSSNNNKLVFNKKAFITSFIIYFIML